MKHTALLAFLLILIIIGCNRNHSTETSAEFTSRIHTTDLDTDWYRPIGQTTLEQHLANFQSINWESEYWKGDSAETFNAPDLEVLDHKTSKYLSVSVCPNTHESFQFYIGLGTQSENTNTGQVKRIVRLYGMGSDNPDKVTSLLKLFFERDFDGICRLLKDLDFFEELEDLYQNIEIQ